ncbi:IS66 family transposase [Klebsiella pneumoniae]
MRPPGSNKHNTAMAIAASPAGLTPCHPCARSHAVSPDEEALKRIRRTVCRGGGNKKGHWQEQRLAERQRKSKPLLSTTESWLRKNEKRCRDTRSWQRRSTLRTGGPDVLCRNGWAEADNNIAENALRMVSLGRKNWLFFGSDHGGEQGALLYSLIGTCKLNGVDRKLPSPYRRRS